MLFIKIGAFFNFARNSYRFWAVFQCSFSREISGELTTLFRLSESAVPAIIDHPNPLGLNFIIRSLKLNQWTKKHGIRWAVNAESPLSNLDDSNNQWITPMLSESDSHFLKSIHGIKKWNGLELCFHNIPVELFILNFRKIWVADWWTLI